jgi:hypothetical protein
MTSLLKLLLGLQAIILILASISHLGLPVPYLIGPRILPAAVIEGVSGLLILYASLHGGGRTAFVCQILAFMGALGALSILSLTGAQHYLVTDLGLVAVLAALGPGLLISDRLSR